MNASLCRSSASRRSTVEKISPFAPTERIRFANNVESRYDEECEWTGRMGER